jgi:hypothetical protein
MLENLRSLDAGSSQKVRVFNDMRFGGYLIFHTPSLQVFVDDRCELYGFEFLEDYVRGRFLQPARIERWADEYAFRYALVIPDERFDQYLKQAPGWELRAECPAASLYERLKTPSSDAPAPATNEPEFGRP